MHAIRAVPSGAVLSLLQQLMQARYCKVDQLQLQQHTSGISARSACLNYVLAELLAVTLQHMLLPSSCLQCLALPGVERSDYTTAAVRLQAVACQSCLHSSIMLDIPLEKVLAAARCHASLSPSKPVQSTATSVSTGVEGALFGQELPNYYSHIYGSCEMLVLAEARDSNIEALYVRGLTIDGLVRENTLSRRCEYYAAALQTAVAIALVQESARTDFMRALTEIEREQCNVKALHIVLSSSSQYSLSSRCCSWKRFTASVPQ
eukprot:21027-Heterococcus_DN1.PRE.2